MEIDVSSPWIGLRNEVPQSDVPRQMAGASKSDGICPNWNRSEWSIRDLEFSHFTELMASIPEVREERVTEVQVDIEGGTYEVMAEKIAEKIIRSDLLDNIF
jgi:anti-sigma28 factor (negative regulator of flagellin synthesis)